MDSKVWAHEIRAFTNFRSADNSAGGDYSTHGVVFKNGLYISGSASSNPGASAALLATDADGMLTLRRLSITDYARSSSYVSGLAGWSIDSADNAEFNDIRARGQFSSSVFNVNEIAATAGTLGVFKSAATLRADFTTPASTGLSFNFNAHNSDVSAMLFAVNDIVRFKTWTGAGISDSWATITARVNHTTYATYTATLESGGTNATFRAGTAVVDYGPTGTGFITLSADGTVGSSPNMTMATHAGSPWSAQTTLLRLGNLNGSYGYASDTYGLGVGQYGTTQSWLTFDTTNGIRIGNNTTALAQWDTSGSILIGQTGAGQGNIYISSGALQMRVGTTVFGQWDTSGNATFGNVATDQANAYWNASNDRLEFRGSTNGTVVQSYIDTDGAFVAGAGAVTINKDGITINSGGESVNQIRWRDAVSDAFSQQWHQSNATVSDYQLMTFAVLATRRASSSIQAWSDTGDLSGIYVYQHGSNVAPNNAGWVALTGGALFAGLSVGASDSTIIPTHMLDVYGDGWFSGSGCTLTVVDPATGSSQYARIIFKTGDREWRFVNDGTDSDKFLIYDATAAATRLQIETSGAVSIFVGGSLKTVEVGAADSGGTGYKMLRVTN